MNQTRIIVIDDEPDICRALAQTLSIHGYQVSWFDAAEKALPQLDEHWRGVVVSDINMPNMDGREFLNKAMEIDPDLSIIMLTGHGDIAMAVECMRKGAYDFLEKPFASDTLLDSIRRALDHRNLVLENRDLKDEVDAQSGPGPRIFGNSKEMRDLRILLMRLKNAEANILISGETGTGKELAARFLHDRSARHDKPFVTICCGAISEDMIELELYGQPADGGSQEVEFPMGKLYGADKGTLYIDGIENMSDAFQLRMLMFLEKKVVQSTGSVVSKKVDVRVIASSKVNLIALVKNGIFRQELFYRLNVIKIDVPALRDRVEDIRLLFENFLRVSSARYGLLTPRLNPVQSSWLKTHNWPGNVRELRNIAERFVLLGDNNIFTSKNEADQPSINMTLAEQVKRFEKTVLKDALIECQGHLKKVQRQLNVPRKTLYEKLKKYNIEKNEYK